MGKGKNKGKSMANDKVEVEVEKEISVSEKVETIEEPKVDKDSEKQDEPANMAIDEAADGAPEEKTGGEKNEEKDEDAKKGDKKSGKNKKKKNKKNKKKPQGQDDKKPETAGGVKEDIQGLIFMCNSKTKEDCFRYRVFGLPKAHKELVEKVTNGMRLFLYDFNLRLMYGIYKAAGKGGYELEPDAFKTSKKPFPAQVRFRIQKECSPLPEEKFKAAIKDNYYGKNKFKFQLNAEQVKKLSQLFRPVPAQNSQNTRGPRDSRPRKPVRDNARAPRRVPFVDQVPQVPLYRPDTVLPQRAPLLDAYALQASDPYASVYQRQALPPADPLPLRNGLLSDIDYRGVDPGLEYLHRQRIRERVLEQNYLDEINRPYVPREADYADAALRRADFTSPPGRSYPSLLGSSSLYRY